MKPSLGIYIALAASLSLLPLSGCGQSQQASSQSVGSDDAATSSTSAEGDTSHDYQLTKPYSYQGVTFLGDPSWTISQPKPYNYYVKIDMPKNSHVSVQTALHGQTATLNGAFLEYFKADGTPTQTDTWSEDGITYCTGYYKSASGPIYLMSGSEEGSGKGFLLSMTFVYDDWTEDQAKSLFDAITATVKYDPSETDMDYHDAFSSSHSNSSSSKGNSSGNGSGSSSDSSSSDTSGTSNESSPQTTATYGPGTLKVGTDIPAGEYKVTSTRSSGEGYWAILNSSGTNANILANDAFTGSSYATVEDGQYFELKGAVATPAQ
jgi:hypothetical protein